MEDYEHILSVLSNMVTVMERSPDAFKSMKEEDLRWQFLVQLNGQCEGRATGETFNAGGKTDILIREEGKYFHRRVQVLDGAKGVDASIGPATGLHHLARHESGAAGFQPGPEYVHGAGRSVQDGRKPSELQSGKRNWSRDAVKVRIRAARRPEPGDHPDGPRFRRANVNGCCDPSQRVTSIEPTWALADF